MKKNSYLKLILSILICQGVGLLGSIFTTKISCVGTGCLDKNCCDLWYQNLIKPSFTPPDWVFSPVWIFLYLLMGISLYLIWKKKSKKKIGYFYIWPAAFLNFLWPALFFGMHNIKLAFIEIFLLWAAILLTIIFFYKISKIAAYLLIPYLLWVSFAIILNYYLLIYSEKTISQKASQSCLLITLVS